MTFEKTPHSGKQIALVKGATTPNLDLDNVNVPCKRLMKGDLGRVSRVIFVVKSSFDHCSDERVISVNVSSNQFPKATVTIVPNVDSVDPEHFPQIDQQFVISKFASSVIVVTVGTHS